VTVDTAVAETERPQAAEPERPDGGMGKVVRGFAALTVASAVSALIGFVVLALVARRVGPHNFGAYQFAMTFTLYFLAPVDFGLTYLAIRDVAQSPTETRKVVDEVLTAQFVLFAACLLVLNAVTAWAAPDAHTQTIILIVSIGYFVQAAGLTWLLQAKQKLGTCALLLLVGQIVYAALTPLLVHSGYDGVKTYAWLNQLGLVITGVGATAIGFWRYGVPKLRLRHPMRLVRRYIRGLPIGATALAASVYLGGDVLVLGYLKGSTAAGLWGAAFKVPLSLFMLVTLWTKAFYPHAARLVKEDPGRLRAQVERLTSIFAVFALPLGVGAVIAGPSVIRAFFGDAYSAAGPAFTILMVWLAVTFVAFNFSDVLLAVGEERRVAVITVGSVVLNFALGVPAIALQGVTGAAWVLLAVQLPAFAALYARFRRVLGPIRVEWRRISRALVAAAAMAAAMLALHGLPVAVPICAGAGVYTVATIALGALRVSELKLLARREATVAEPV
jgi:O-antigen/teichoic acid export membrane protein